MKRNLTLVFAGFLLSVIAVVAAPTGQTSVLVSCDTAGELERGRMVYSGNVRVQFASPSTMVARAQTMTYDALAHRMTLSGEVEITGNGPVVRSKDVTLDFGSSELNVHRLNPAGIVVGSGPDLTSPHMAGKKAFAAPEETRKP